MSNLQALEEAVLYLAGALDAGQRVTGAGLRALVEWTRGLSGDVPIGEVWARAQGALDAGRQP